MIKLIHVTRISFTIWVAAALINGVSAGVWSLFTIPHPKEAIFLLVIGIISSLVLSIPAMFIFWIFFVANYYKEGLFQLLLKTALFTSVLSAIIFFGGFHLYLPSGNVWLMLFIVISAISAVMVHRRAIKNIFINHTNNINV